MTRTVTVALAERSYAITIGASFLRDLASHLPHLAQPRVIVVTNPTVAALYLDCVAASLRGASLKVDTIVVPDGEAYKSWDTLYSIHTQLLEAKAERSTTLIALGGGVVGDLAGFVAATYQRGTPFIQIPTTLLAQVDSSVGGKTGVNHPLGKNMIGAFYQPQAVIIDTDTLTTLPDRELRAGLAEVIKYGIIRDRPFFEWLEANVERLLAREPDTLAQAIERSCSNKAEVVARDERESGERMLLNFGHTFGHAIEVAMGYGAWLHGEAVAAGMVLAADMSLRQGWVSRDTRDRIVTLIKRAGLPTAPPHIEVARYRELMSHDKKSSGGQITLVLLKGIGAALATASYDATLLDQTLRGA